METIPVANPSPPRRLRFPRREIALALTAAAVGGAIAIAVLFAWPNSDASPIFTAGLVEDFEPGTVTYFEGRHVFLVRLTDGGFLALSDSAQHLEGETVEWRPDFEFQGVKGWFRSPAHQETFAMDGTLAFGPARGDMTRFQVTTSNTRVRIDTTRTVDSPN